MNSRPELTPAQHEAFEVAKLLLARDKEAAERDHIKALSNAYEDFYKRLEEAGIDAKTVDWLNDA